ncbi:hypothetical protein GQ55_5G471900 [Panicum hallii var. hallii]|uniref:Uncharacterized protein n=1 Tax=Panicum hallii var. hallii TaxID=1504633 RepID=A0A2T7DQU2_9POAL|nr:hypothetical protein GQ55_5G471900 [Panicum hallii var. hallii]
MRVDDGMEWKITSFRCWINQAASTPRGGERSRGSLSCSGSRRDGGGLVGARSWPGEAGRAIISVAGLG